MIRVAFVFLWMAGTAGLAGQSSLRQAVSRGDEAARAGRFAAAVRAYDEALGLADPTNGRIMGGLFYKKARALRGAGEILRALKAVEQARSYERRQEFDDLYSELQDRASATVFDSDQIRKALNSARSFGVAGGAPSLNVWVGFAFDSAELTTRGTRQATEMADAMLASEFEGSRFLLVGHTDTQGREEYNFDLSYRRARQLREWLIDRFGFRADRIDAEGRGEEEPVASGDSPSDHARNRRVELRLID